MAGGQAATPPANISRIPTGECRCAQVPVHPNGSEQVCASAPAPQWERAGVRKCPCTPARVSRCAEVPLHPNASEQVCASAPAPQR
eukprot:98205-Chlamydomonas_euryale.AAC.2